MPEDSHRRSHLLRNQHSELLRLIADLRAQLDPGRLARDGARARTLLAMLAGTLGVHLAMEDKAFYARLLKHKSSGVRELASSFMADVEGLQRAFDEYVAHWPTAQAIQANGPQFVNETERVVEVLGKRIEQEHELLFPALDGAAESDRFGER